MCQKDMKSFVISLLPSFFQFRISLVEDDYACFQTLFVRLQGIGKRSKRQVNVAKPLLDWFRIIGHNVKDGSKTFPYSFSQRELELGRWYGLHPLGNIHLDKIVMSHFLGTEVGSTASLSQLDILETEFAVDPEFNLHSGNTLVELISHRGGYVPLDSAGSGPFRFRRCSDDADKAVPKLWQSVDCQERCFRKICRQVLKFARSKLFGCLVDFPVNGLLVRLNATDPLPLFPTGKKRCMGQTLE